VWAKRMKDGQRGLAAAALPSGCAGVLMLTCSGGGGGGRLSSSCAGSGRAGPHLGDAAGQALEPADAMHKAGNGAAVNTRRKLPLGWPACRPRRVPLWPLGAAG
jgi:hypothetical protein